MLQPGYFHTRFTSKRRLDRLVLFSLNRRMLGGNLIEVCNIMRDIDRVDCQSNFLMMEVSKTIGHRFKL